MTKTYNAHLWEFHNEEEDFEEFLIRKGDGGRSLPVSGGGTPRGGNESLIPHLISNLNHYLTGTPKKKTSKKPEIDMDQLMDLLQKVVIDNKV